MPNDFSALSDASQILTLRDAVKDGAIIPVYQPIVHFQTAEVSSFEVLARWRHQDYGEISPTVFIPLVEQVDLIGELTAALIQNACSSAVGIQGNFRLAINIFPRIFVRRDARAVRRGREGLGVSSLQDAD